MSHIVHFGELEAAIKTVSKSPCFEYLNPPVCTVGFYASLSVSDRTKFILNLIKYHIITYLRRIKAWTVSNP